MNMYRFHDPARVTRARIGVFAALVLGAVLVLALGMSLVWSSKQNIADLESRIARVDALPQTGAAPETVFLTAESPNIAQTLLQTQVQEIAAAHQLEIEVIRSDELEDQGRAIALGILLNGVIPEGEFAGFLTSLDAARPRILVDTLDLRRARVTSRRDPAPKLALRMGLKGVMLK